MQRVAMIIRMRAEIFYMAIETTEAKRGDYERLRQIFLLAFFTQKLFKTRIKVMPARDLQYPACPLSPSLHC